MKQPKALYLINFVSMWECFSYYGMRVLLVLFMIQVLHYSDSAAFGLYAIYTTLIDLGGVVGGIAADRFFGLKRSITIGGWIIALGHLCLAIPDQEAAFFLGLGLIIVGTGLFRSNAAVLLGQYYGENDPRRDAGYTLYYTGINIGGFLASVCCGIVGEVYGWHAGFGVAAIGMLSGNAALYFGRKILEDKGEPQPEIMGTCGRWKILSLCLAPPAVALALYHHTLSALLLPLAAIFGIYYVFKQTQYFSQKEKSGLYRLALYVVFVVVFYGCEEQLGSSLILFAERHVDRNTWFGMIPAASLIMFNPLTILVTGPLLSRILQRYPVQGLTMIGISFFLLGTAFSLLYFGSSSIGAGDTVPLAYIIGSFFIIALGELFIGPTVYAYASEIAPRNFQGLVMGIVTMGYSLANLFSGWISQMMAVVEGTDSLEVYSGGFGMIGLSTIGLGVVLMFFNLRKKVLVP
jgi:POT family proton-dependent oligopeptide transporter